MLLQRFNELIAELPLKPERAIRQLRLAVRELADRTEAHSTMTVTRLSQHVSRLLVVESKQRNLQTKITDYAVAVRQAIIHNRSEINRVNIDVRMIKLTIDGLEKRLSELEDETRQET